MGSDRDETAQTFDVSAEAALPSLDAVDRVAWAGQPITEELEATFFDTDEFSLAAEGIEIRRQTGDDDPGWHVKLPISEGHHNVRLPLSRAVRTVPKELRTAVLAFERDRPLRAVARVGTDRTVHQLLDSDGGLVAEIYDDEVTAEVLGGPDEETTPQVWRSWQLQPVEAESALLAAVTDVLLESGARRVGAGSQLVRALGARLRSQPPSRQAPVARLQRKSPAREVLQARLIEQTGQLRQLDPLVRRDVPDAVHKSRVAMRRLRSALATFRPFFDREVTDPVREELKWIAGVLGEVRDTEVVHSRISALVDAEQQAHPDLVGPQVRQLVDRVLGDRYRRAHATAQEAMESRRYFQLLDSLDAVRADPPWTQRATRPAKEVLPARVARDYKRLRRRVEAAGRTEDTHQRAERLHESRKAAKRTRYAAETLAPVYGQDADRFIAAIEGVQSVLGEHHDSTVSQQEINRLSEVATSEDVNALPLGLLHVREEACAAQAENTFTKAWAKASRPKKRKWLL